MEWILVLNIIVVVTTIGAGIYFLIKDNEKSLKDLENY